MSCIEFTEAELDIAGMRAVARAVPGQHLPSGWDVAHRVACSHGLKAQDLIGPSRLMHVARARFELYAALRDIGWSYPAIGRFVGGRDHTTVMAGVRVHRARAGRAA